ncbi:hypothetical protein Pmar_PMAR023803 [Perkinsus marinus ATCC 50983]|uniref:Uncharacterized protein n=1 Tax=Perkinsus marinus (strain ATCC 50983 / TXsc) TaxID=423536 RepID=C5KYJ4_PERM5|nr:hypothetical protein Pmar_PMAR023803 [Perkinsus marinus ATCC 50983]EER10429.1 hypothetical protein Pmar_PMAR023803 [Perkinsus marinus ATCC 50983]|eukprot:XP_002778634.1 hypothetical protein Pmar_PMAR023803 [Perkinsus marinus ATCC 50983]
MGKLIVKAEAYDEGSESYGIPGIEVEGEERSRAEEALSQGGPFSPLAHLKGKTVGPLITSIDWKADSEQLKCDKIFHFIANHPPGGYPKGDLRWLFDFVEANTERIQGIIEGWEPIKKKRDSEKKRSLLKKIRQRFSRK